MLKLIIIWVLAGLFTLNSTVITLRANFTFGTALMWMFSILLVAYGLFHKKIDAFCADGAGRVLKIIFFIGMAVFAAMLVFVAVSGRTHTAKGDEKAIIILGAGLRGEEVGGTLERRLVAGLKAWNKNQNAVIVVTGGQGKQEVIPEALAMQRWLVAKGVPENKIIMEDKSTSTEENLVFAKALLIEAGITPDQPVSVVTNSFHCYRGKHYAHMAGFTDPRSVPASIGPWAVMPCYMREVFAVIYMWVFKQ